MEENGMQGGMMKMCYDDKKVQFSVGAASDMQQFPHP